MTRDVLAAWRLVRLLRDDELLEAPRAALRERLGRPSRTGPCGSTLTVTGQPHPGVRRCALTAGHDPRHVATLPGGRLVVHEWTDSTPGALPHRLPAHPKLLELTGCAWCLSVWAALTVVVLRRRAPWLRDVLAVSQAVGLAVELLEAVPRRSPRPAG